MRPRVRDRDAKFDSDKPAVKIMFQVTQIVRFLLEALRGGLRFRNLVFCGHDASVMETATFKVQVQCTGTGLPGRTRLFPAIS